MARESPGDDDEHPQDVVGCVWTTVRFGCGSLFLYILMFLAVLAVAVISLLFYR